MLFFVMSEISNFMVSLFLQRLSRTGKGKITLSVFMRCMRRMSRERSGKQFLSLNFLDERPENDVKELHVTNSFFV